MGGKGAARATLGRFFWIDPFEELTAVLMTQRPGPTRAHYRRLIKQPVHTAITDSAADGAVAEVAAEDDNTAPLSSD